jgi:cobalamin biosynthetic protein CobC
MILESSADAAMMKDEAPIAHGGALDEARRRYPLAPEPWIDLSTGINPVAYPLPAIPPEAWMRLPFEREEWELRQAAAVRYGAADAESVTAAPGTQALIQIIPRLLGPSRVAVLGPTYAEHGIAWKREGHEVYEVGSLERTATADVVIVVNPNNPTGRVIPISNLARKAEALADRGGLLIVDEAFMDVLDPSASVIRALPPATIVLRSFGKMYGLAGLRLGFAVTDRTMAARLRDLLGPWAVSGPGIAIGRAALGDGVWLAQARRRLSLDAQRLDRMLAGAGCEVLGGTPLFRLVAHRLAEQIGDTLAHRGVLVRRFSHAPTWLRFGIPGSEAAWLRLTDALAASLHFEVV